MNPLTTLNRKRRPHRPRDVQTTTIDDLTDGLLVEIFVRLLHAKSVNQCKSVCKRWLTLISTPWLVRSFVRHQITISNGNGTQSPPTSSTPLRFPFTFITEHPQPHHEEYFRLISSPDMFGLGGLSLTYLPCYGHDESNLFVISVLATSNDLILCESRFSPGFYYVSNPFTQHWAKIPSGSYKYKGKIIGFVCDPFYKVVDDENGYHTIDTMYRYKIVRVCYWKPDPYAPFMPPKMEIFSSEMGEWSELDLKIACPRLLQVIGTYLSSGCGSSLFNGKLHWMCGENYIFAYDPFNSNNNVEVIDRPEELRGARNVHLGVSGERLRLMEFRENSRIVVWEPEDYSTGKWCKVKEVSMDMGEIHETFEFMVDTNTMTIAFHPYDENIVYVWCPFSASYVISCNLQHGSFEMVIAGSKDNSFHYCADKVFLLLQPWFPTPVSSQLLSFSHDDVLRAQS